MTTHKTISSLSIAAIALMAAAVPAMAQGQTEPSGKSVSADGVTTVQTIATNLESSTVRKSRSITPKVEPAANAVRTSKPLVFSASAFKGQNQFTSTANTTNFANQVNFKDAGPFDPGAKKQFRADESEITRTKEVTFVPSRGQKLPE
jgi:hypothetical protein